MYILFEDLRTTKKRGFGNQTMRLETGSCLIGLKWKVRLIWAKRSRVLDVGVSEILNCEIDNLFM